MTDYMERCAELEQLLRRAAPHVYASASAEHMLDGFRSRRRAIDDLVEQIKAALADAHS